MKRVKDCPDGSYVDLQNRMANGDLTGNCQACTFLFSCCNPDLEHLKMLLEKAVSGKGWEHVETQLNAL